MTGDDRLTVTAWICHEAFRAVQANGPHLADPWDSLGEGDKARVRRGVVRAQLGMTAEASHDAWRAELLAAGWQPGPKHDPVALTHPNLVPWLQLPEAERGKSRLFHAIAMSRA